MPLLEYQCLDCRNIEERLVNITEIEEAQFCLQCGAQMETIPSRPAPPVFAGKPWNS